jgi:hypothetical protein
MDPELRALEQFGRVAVEADDMLPRHLCEVMVSVGDPDPDPVGSGPFCRIRIRIRKFFTGSGSGSGSGSDPPKGAYYYQKR